MYLLLIILASLVPYTCCLIGGENVTGKVHYFVVSIQDIHGHHICGGAIYADLFILTAATCVTGMQPKEVFVLAGAEDLAKGFREKEGVLLRVNKIILKKPVGKNGIRNDIAILRLTEKIIESYHIKSIPLPENEVEADQIGEEAYFFGWGQAYKDGSEISNTLRSTFLTLKNLDICGLRNPDINETNICTSEVRKSLCKFDAGGPLETSTVLWGIATSDQSCNNVLSSDIYTRVYSYKDWILDVVKKNFGNIIFEPKTTFKMTICGIITHCILNFVR